MNWTEDQKKVIETSGRNILVSAAAGSGKTAVLVERILEKISDPEKPVGMDEMLIVTFTKAAAGEMRERLLKRITEALAKDPDNEQSLHIPTVIEERCIGCGACENLCPARPISAITIDGLADGHKRD